MRPRLIYIGDTMPKYKASIKRKIVEYYEIEIEAANSGEALHKGATTAYEITNTKDENEQERWMDRHFTYHDEESFTLNKIEEIK